MNVSLAVAEPQGREINTTHDEMERAIEFLLDHQAQLRTDLDVLTGLVTRLGGEVSALSGDVRALTGNVNALTEEMREGFGKLILVNGSLESWPKTQQ
jgi:hypothetical protein